MPSISGRGPQRGTYSMVIGEPGPPGPQGPPGLGAPPWTQDVVNLNDQSTLIFDNPSVDNAAALRAILLDASRTGRKVIATQPATLWVGQCRPAIEGDLIIETVLGFVIKGLDNPILYPKDVIYIEGGTYRPKLRIIGLTVDNSLRPFAEGAATGTALGLANMSQFYISQCRFLSTDWRDQKGDSGITTVMCENGTIDSCYFRGQPDLGVYLSGGPSNADVSDDYGDQTVQNCTFYRCNGAGKQSREMRRTVWCNNRVVECRAGFYNVEAGTPAPLNVGVSPDMIIEGNFFKRIGSRAVLGAARHRSFCQQHRRGLGVHVPRGWSIPVFRLPCAGTLPAAFAAATRSAFAIGPAPE